MAGFVTLVGAGSGDVNLLTLGGKSVLQGCDVVVYDRLISTEILDLIPDEVERIDVGKSVGVHPVPQEEINRILLELALSGKRVVRLKGGDNFLFGRGGEELELLKENSVGFSVIPGVSSPFSASSYAGFPLTHREFSSSVHIFTGHKKRGEALQFDYASLVKLDGTLVFLMAISSISEIIQGLLSEKMSAGTPIVAVEHGTLSTQRVVRSTLSEMLNLLNVEEFLSPTIFFIGKVCSLEYPWFSAGSLQGKNVLITTPSENKGDLFPVLQKEGANVTVYSELVMKEKEFTLPNLEKFSMLVFTSRRGVESFFGKLFESDLDVRVFSKHKFAVVGQGTARILKKYGICADFVPSRAESGDFVKELLDKHGEECFLLIQGETHTWGLQEEFDKRRVSYETILSYEVAYEKKEIPLDRNYDLVVFTSGNGVGKFLEFYPELRELPSVSIGNTTKNVALKLGFKTKVAENTTIESVVECVKEYFIDE